MNYSEKIIFNLSNQSKKKFPIIRLYRTLYKSELYEEYLEKLNLNEFDEKEFKEALNNLITQLKTEQYDPKEESDNLRIKKALNLVLLEIIADYLEVIYEGQYENNINYSFREELNIHHALLRAKEITKDSNYLMTLNIDKSLFEFSKTLIDKRLREVIKDERFIRLINKYLNNNLEIENNTFSRTYLGNRLLNVLSNFYMQPFDTNFIDFVKRKSNINIKAVRYSNEILIALDNKDDIEKVEKLISEFFLENFSNFTIKNLKKNKNEKRTTFLSHELMKLDINNDIKVFLFIPKSLTRKIAKSLKLVKNTNDKNWKTVHRNNLLNFTDLDILRTYNKELKKIYVYYSLANNVSQKLGQLHYLMEYSCLKTLARKHRTSLKKLRTTLNDGNEWSIRDEQKSIKFFKGFKRRFKASQKKDLDQLPYFLIR